MHPHIEIWQSKGGKERKVRDFVMPVGAVLLAEHGQKIHAGETIAKISREAYKTRDITGGLPRVAELFEARRPKDPATISEIDGVVRFGDIKRGKREIFVQPMKAIDSQVAVDETPMGTFVEIEGAPPDIEEAANRLGQSRNDYILDSYPSLYRQWCESNRLPEGDMLFGVTT